MPDFDDLNTTGTMVLRRHLYKLLITLSILIVSIMLPVAIRAGDVVVPEQDKLLDSNQPDLIDFTADYHCRNFFGSLSLWNRLTYYDSDDRPAVHVFIYNNPGVNTTPAKVRSEIRKARKRFQSIANEIRKIGSDNYSRVLKLRIEGRTLLEDIRKSDDFVSIYVSATRTHSPVVEWRRGLPESYTDHDVYRDHFKQITKEKPTSEKYYYFGPLNIVYSGRSPSMNTLISVDRSGRFETPNEENFRQLTFRRLERSSPATLSSEKQEFYRRIDEAWSFIENAKAGILPSDVGPATITKIAGVPDFMQWEFANIFPAMNCCAVLAFADVLGYHDQHGYWNLFDLTYKMGAANSNGAFPNRQYPGNFWDDAGAQAVDEVMMRVAEALQYDFIAGGTGYGGCVNTLDTRHQTFTNGSTYGNNLSFTSDQDGCISKASWADVQNEINNNRPMTVRSTHFSWNSDGGPYNNIGGHQVVLFGVDTAKAGYTQAICVHVNGTNTPGDVWWDYADLVNCYTWEITPGGNPGPWVGDPTLLSPTGTITDQSPTFDWSTTSNTNRYRLQVSLNDDFSQIVLDTEVTASAYTPGSNLNGGLYYWRVVPRNTSNNWCEFTDAQTFTISIPQPPPAAPSWVAVEDGNSTSSLEVRWASVPGCSYRMYRSTSPTVSSSTEIGATVNTYHYDSSAEHGQTYYYWIRAKRTSDNKSSAFSNYDAGWRKVPSPESVAATNASYTGCVKITWTGLSGALFQVYRSDSEVGTKMSLGVDWLTETRFYDTTADPGKSYCYWVVARKNDKSSDYSIHDWGWRGVPVPTNVSASDGAHTNKVAITWDGYSGAQFQVWYSLSPTGNQYALSSWQSGTSYNHLGVEPGKDINYFVKASKNSVDSALSDYDLGWRKVPAPTSLVASDGTYNDKVALSWSGYSGCEFIVYRNTSTDSGTSTAISSWQTAKSYDDTSVTPGVSYTYWVKARKNSKQSDFSSYDQGIAKPAAPSGLGASDGTSTTQVAVAWNSVSGATYRVYRSVSSGGTKTALGADWQGGTTYYDTSTDAGQTYYYWVKSKKGGVESDYSQYNTGWRAVPQPTNVSATKGAYNDHVAISWNGYSSAEFLVYKGTLANGSNRTSIGSWQSAVTYNDYSVAQSQTYYYWIKARKNGRESNISSSSDSGFSSPDPTAAPTGVIATDGSDTSQVTITWNTVSGATYQVFRSTTTSPPSTPLSTTWQSSTSYNDTVADPGLTYYYWVKAKIGTAESGYSDYNSGYRAVPVPTSVSATDGTYASAVRVSWSGYPGAEFRVYRNTVNNSGTSTAIGSWQTSSMYNDSVAPGTTYYYWVKARRNGQESAFSTYDTGYSEDSTQAPPTNVQASDGTYTDKVRITWDAAPGATEYDVLWDDELSGSRGYVAAGTTNLYAEHSSAEAGKNLYYWVKARNGGTTSGYSEYDSGWKKPMAPVNINASDGSFTDKTTIAWDDIYNTADSSFRVYRSTSSDGTKELLGASWQQYPDEDFDDTSASQGMTYYYWVKCKRFDHESDYSSYNTGCLKPRAQTGILAEDGVMSTRVRITFDTISGLEYRVFRSTSEGGIKTMLGSGWQSNNYFDDTTGEYGKTYYYYVKARKYTIDSGYVEGDFSNVDAGWRKVPAPGSVAASDGTDTSKVLVSWGSVSGAEYRLYRSETESGAKLAWSDWQNGTSADDTIADPGTTYYYWVKARMNGQESDFSSNNTGWRGIPAPTSVEASDGGYTDKVRITWNGLTGAEFSVYRATSAGGAKTTLSVRQSSTTFDDTSASAGTTYYYWIKARISGHESDFSSNNTGYKLLPPAWPGPDAYGYIGSQITGYFENIDSSGTDISFSNQDDDLQQIPIGFTFRYYGNNYTNVYVSTNGFLTFSVTGSMPTNFTMPNMTVPGAIIAPYWDNLSMVNRGYVKYQVSGTAPNRRLIVQWRTEHDDYPDPGVSRTYRFQVKLFEGNSRIEIHYNDVYISSTATDVNYGKSATVGMQNSDGSRGLRYNFNGSTLISSSDALRFDLPNAIPENYSLSPTNGSGLKPTFTATYRDGDGNEDLRYLYLKIAPSADAQANCAYFRYRAATQKLDLRSDGGGSWRGGYVIGSNNTLQNSQVKVDISQVTVTISGNDMTLNLPVELRLPFAGSHIVAMNVFDMAYANPGWQEKGTFTVYDDNQTPQVISVSPDTGRSMSQTFTTQYRDADGSADLRYLYFKIAPASGSTSNCAYLRYRPATRKIDLRSDAGGSWLGGYVIGNSQTLQNSQVSIDVSQVSASTNATTITLSLPLQFKAAFTGSHNIFMNVFDMAYKSPGWMEEGSYTVGEPNEIPENHALNPASGSGGWKTFTTIYKDGDGCNDLRYVYFKMADSAADVANCVYVRYRVVTGKIDLRTNTGGSWIYGPVIGTVATIGNSQVKMNCANISVIKSGKYLTVKLPLVFKSGFSGAKNIYMFCSDSVNQNSGWQLMGTFTVTPSDPPS